MTSCHHASNRGYSTATTANVAYRLGLVASRGLLVGRWLDCGAAEGGFAAALHRHGASEVVAIDIEHSRVVEGSANCDEPSVVFACAASEALPLRNAQFDGVLLNEVLEHVADERATLCEIRRVLRPGGHLVLMSPNRWFPFEGHGLALRHRALNWPVPFVPWLPKRWFRHSLRARNYWPRELIALVEDTGFTVRHSQSVFPMFDHFRWLPSPLIRHIRGSPDSLGRVPIVRRMGVSTMVIAQRES